MKKRILVIALNGIITGYLLGNIHHAILTGLNPFMTTLANILTVSICFLSAALSIRSTKNELTNSPLKIFLQGFSTLSVAFVVFSIYTFFILPLLIYPGTIVYYPSIGLIALVLLAIAVIVSGIITVYYILKDTHVNKKKN